MAKARIAPHRPAPPSFSEIERLAGWLRHHAFAIYGRASDIESLQNDDNPDVEKVEVARALFGKIIARRLVLLVGVATQLNALLEDKAPLSPKDEAWLRRQLDGIQGGGA